MGAVRMGGMSDEYKNVLVYLYTYWDADSQSQKTSTQYATSEAIRNGLGQFVPASERKVLRAELMEGAFYVPPPEEFLNGNPMAIESVRKVAP